MTVLRQISLLALKDLRIEARSRQTIGLVVVLGILIVTVLGLGLNLNPQRGVHVVAAPDASSQTPSPQPSPGVPGEGVKPAPPVASGTSAAGATGILWVAYLFAGVLCFEKTMALERQDGALAGLLLAPIDRGVIYAGKLISNLALMFAVAAVITPVGILFFGFDLSAHPFAFTGIMGLSMVGFAAVGTLFSAVVSSSRLQGGLLAMVVFPISLPLVISSTQITSRLYQPGGVVDGKAFAVLVSFDLIFLVVSWIAFEWVIEP